MPSESCTTRAAARAALLLSTALAGCASLRGKEGSSVITSLSAASGYWFRGTPLSTEPVMQGDLIVSTPLATGGNITFTTWYNGQLTNSTGNGLFPDGNGGEMTEIDMALDYAQTFGPVKLTGGGITYSYPQVRASTKEAYLAASTEALGLVHTLTAYYDVDILHDYYLSYQAARSLRLAELWSTTLTLRLGYMSDDQASFYFGRSEAGLSDLTLDGRLNYALDPNVTMYLEVAGVTVPDDSLAASLDNQGFDNSGVWVELGLAWGL